MHVITVVQSVWVFVPHFAIAEFCVAAAADYADWIGLFEMCLYVFSADHP